MGYQKGVGAFADKLRKDVGAARDMEDTIIGTVIVDVRELGSRYVVGPDWN